MSKRTLWLAISACCLSFVAVSCGDDDDSSPSTPQGGSENAAGSGVDDGGSGGSTTAGTKSTGADGGVPGSNGGAPVSAGAGGTSEPGAGGEPTSSGGEPNVGEGGAGGAPIVTDTLCASLADCDKGQYCLKLDCAAETGVCATPTGTGPVCACGGVTYYNSALAIAAKADVAKAGICSGAGAKACGLKAACAKGQTCGTVSAGRATTCAASNTPSVCWQLPAKCPAEKASYNLCTSDKCVGLCSAVASGEEAIGSALACSIKLP